MNYIFEINVFTDGDFRLDFVPMGMEANDDYDYVYKKVYTDREYAIKDITNICTFLKEQIKTPRDYVKEEWNECIDNFINKLNLSEKAEYEFVGSYMDGNYDGTEFTFSTESLYYNCTFNITNEEAKMIKDSKAHVTRDMIKNAILDLFRGNYYE